MKALLDKPMKVIIDADPGVDDAFAIFYAIYRPEFDVIGITTTFGNSDIWTTTRNALVLLEIAGRPDIPVAQGCEVPLGMGPEEWHAILSSRPRTGSVHGANGLGDVQVPEPHLQPVDIDAVDFILRTVAECPGEITLVAIGRLTNIAAAIIKDRKTMEKLVGISFMGGAVRAPGNSSAVSEANIHGDPLAADLVMTLDVPKVMVGLDVTMKAIVTEDDVQRMLRYESPQVDFLVDASRHYDQFYRNRDPKLGGFAVHDVLAFTYLVRPELFVTQDAYVRVETVGRFTKGQTVADLRSYSKEKANCTVCLDVDGRAVIEDLHSTLRNGGVREASIKPPD